MRNPFFPDINRPIFLPKGAITFIFWSLFRPYTLNKYLRQLGHDTDSDIGFGTPWWTIYTIWRRNRDPRLLHYFFFVTASMTFAMVMFIKCTNIWSYVLSGNFSQRTAALLFLGFIFTVSSKPLSTSIWFGVLLQQALCKAGDALGLTLLNPIAYIVVVYFIGSRFPSLPPAYSIRGFLDSLVPGLMAGGLLFAVSITFHSDIVHNLYQAFALATSVYLIAVYALIDYLIVSMFYILYLTVGKYYLLNNRKAFFYIKGLPPFWHEMIRVPLYFLDDAILAARKQNRELIEYAVEYLSVYPADWTPEYAARIWCELRLEDMRAAHNVDNIAKIYHMLRDYPKPLMKGKDAYVDFLESLIFVTGKVNAGLESLTAEGKVAAWREALETMKRWRGRLLLLEKSENCSISDILYVLQLWENVLYEAIEDAERKIFIAISYAPGNALSPGSPLFKGRKKLIETLERAFFNYRKQQISLLLYGGRRMGKTSLINQLPEKLGPEVVPVKLDLQGMAQVPDKEFWYVFARQIVSGALKTRQLKLPEPDESRFASGSFAAFQLWLESVGKSYKDYYFLVTLDEYETLERSIDRGLLSEEILDSLRWIIQNQVNWLLVFVGLRTFGDLSSRWNDRFVNVQSLLVGVLEDEAASALILEPEPGLVCCRNKTVWCDGYDPRQQSLCETKGIIYEKEAVEHLLRVTGKHPNWLQAILRDLVLYLTQEGKRDVSIEDITYLIDKAVMSGTAHSVIVNDFNNIWESAYPFGIHPTSYQVDLYKKVLLNIAKKPGITSQELVQSLRDSESVFKVVAFFKLREMLHVDESNGLRWSFPIFEDWLKKIDADPGEA